MVYRHAIDATTYVFNDLRDLLAKATPPRSGDRLAGVAADSAAQMIAARIALADVPLKQFLHEAVIPYEDDEITRLIIDTHDQSAFAAISALTVGRSAISLPDAAKVRSSQNYCADRADGRGGLEADAQSGLSCGKCEVTSAFRTWIGCAAMSRYGCSPIIPSMTPGSPRQISTASVWRCLYHNPGDDPAVIGGLSRLLDDIIARLQIPTQSCVLTHVTTTLGLIDQGIPVDLVFQSIAGTQAANRSFGVDLALLHEAHQAGLSLRRGTVGNNVMYFETGQGSALSANAHHGVDQQTCEARAYAVARAFDPLLVNSVVGFIGPEYLYDGKEIIRAGLEDHFCGKLLGLPLGVDVCYTNHAEADQDDMDNLLTLLAAAGVTFIMGVPGADDVMLNYQSTSFHDALYIRDLFGLKRAPEFDDWLFRAGLADADFRLAGNTGLLPDFASRLIA
jgi:ethanolamine ammonia-lyase large subunit